VVCPFNIHGLQRGVASSSSAVKDPYEPGFHATELKNDPEMKALILGQLIYEPKNPLAKFVERV